jgi:hypothetical protein
MILGTPFWVCSYFMTENNAISAGEAQKKFSSRGLGVLPEGRKLIPFIPPGTERRAVTVVGTAPTPQSKVLPDGEQYLGVRKRRKPPGYWQQAGNIEAELHRFEEKYGQEFTHKLAKQHGETALGDAVIRHSSVRVRRPRGYWQDPENIAAERQRFIEIYGKFTPALAKKHGARMLLNAIYEQRETKIERSKPLGYWKIPGVLDAEISQFEAEHGLLTKKSAREHGESDLINAVYRRNVERKQESVVYPWEPPPPLKKRKGERYWTDERILLAVEVFRRRHGDFSIPMAREYGVPPGLIAAIYTYGHKDLLTITRPQNQEKTNHSQSSGTKRRLASPHPSEEFTREEIRDVLAGDKDWRFLSACGNPEAITIFENGTDAQRKEICQDCIVGGFSLADAFASGSKQGVVGGMGPSQRGEALRRVGRDNIWELVQHLREDNRKYLAKLSS